MLVRRRSDDAFDSSGRVTPIHAIHKPKKTPRALTHPHDAEPLALPFLAPAAAVSGGEGHGVSRLLQQRVGVLRQQGAELLFCLFCFVLFCLC